jgi:hypothetical protein
MMLVDVDDDMERVFQEHAAVEGLLAWMAIMLPWAHYCHRRRALARWWGPR